MKDDALQEKLVFLKSKILYNNKKLTELIKENQNILETIDFITHGKFEILDYSTEKITSSTLILVQPNNSKSWVGKFKRLLEIFEISEEYLKDLLQNGKALFYDNEEYYFDFV